MTNGSAWFGLAAVITAIATLIQTIRSTPPRPPRRARRAKHAPPVPPVDSADPAPPAPAARARLAVAWRALLTLVFAGASAATGPPAGALPPPIAAHHQALAGVVACSSAGEQLVTWTIGNEQPRLAMSIVSATGDHDGAPVPVSGYVSPVAPASSTSAASVLPGAADGRVALTVTGSWVDGHQNTRTAAVTLPGACTASTTTAPATSTSTSSTPPTSAVDATSTPPASEVPGSPQASGSPDTSSPAAMLADTGPIGPVLGAVIAGLAIVLLGATFIMAFRADRRLGHRLTRRGRRGRGR